MRFGVTVTKEAAQKDQREGITDQVLPGAMNEWCCNNSHQSTHPLRVHAQLMQIPAEHHLKDFNAPDQESKSNGEVDTGLECFIVTIHLAVDIGIIFGF